LFVDKIHAQNRVKTNLQTNYLEDIRILFHFSFHVSVPTHSKKNILKF